MNSTQSASHRSPGRPRASTRLIAVDTDPDTMLRDRRSGLSGRLLQSVRKCVHAADRMGRTT